MSTRRRQDPDRRRTQRQGRRANPPTQSLSAQEIEVLRLLASGATNRQIAGELSISQRTVRLHLERARRKTGARDRTELAVLAIQDGFFPVPSADDEAEA